MTAETDSAAPGLPLTQGQTLIWTGQQLHPEVPLYNMAFLFTIHGPIDSRLFHRAFDRLVRRCDLLRTVVSDDDGRPRQLVLPVVDGGLVDVDLAATADPEAAARQWAQARCQRPFELAQRLFDSALIRLGEGRHAWFFNQHHVVCDAWSVALLFDALSQTYLDLRDPAAQGLPPLPAFGAYVRYEAAARDRQDVSEHWQQLRRQAPPPAPLYGYARPADSTASVRLALPLDADRSSRLVALADSPGVRTLSRDLALFNLFATVLFAFVYRVSGQDRLAIGAPAHNRPTTAFKRTPGMFTEVYPLHVEVGADDSFTALYQKVALQTNDLLRHALPGASHPGNNAGCNVVLNYIKASFPRFAGSPVDALWLHAGHKDRQHHLRLQVHDFGDSGRLKLYFDLNRDVFDARRGPLAVGHFERLLDALLEDWGQAIGRVDLLSGEERGRQLKGFNSTAAAAVAGDYVLQRFRAHVRSAPEAAALVCGDRTLSYAGLNRLTDRLARQLQARLAADDGIVAVCTRRSIESLIGLLGVMKTGRAYLPLDPDWPPDRLAYVLADAAVSTVVMQPALEVAWPATIDTLPIGSDESVVDDDPPLPTAAPTADATAYVMYTSGSTGRPKGVVVRQGGLANYLAWAAAYYVRGRRLRFPLFTPLTFDLTVTSLFLPLTTGGSLVIYPQRDAEADLALLDVLDEDAVDVVKLTPSHLGLIQGRDLSESGIEQLILGGEDLSSELARNALSAFGGRITIHNEYGPTEGTVGCIVHRYQPEFDTTGPVPIGRPISNMQAYVLDRYGGLVPEGVVGELHIGGAGLAEGYLKRPGLTAAQFAEHRQLGGVRLYRTGDLARLGERGGLEYLGRADHQVKIRGARIELGEIEDIIASHPQVSACVVSTYTRDPAQADTDPALRCVRCGLPSNYPGAEFDTEGVCNQCRGFDAYRDRAAGYFRSMEDLQALFAAQPPHPAGGYDCMALLSGGKDSTYMLCRLADMGLRVLAFTLDNGYLSEQAKANIRRVADTLGVDHVFGSTPAMNEIFVDSLRRHANVCQGCFKTLYTLSVNLALEKGIPFIVTGLSRGQFFETRLTEELFTTPGYDSARIDRTILQARKAYHRVNDAVRRLLDVAAFDDDAVFDKVQFVDFYRYCPVDLEQMLDYLGQRVAWVRPTDTGRSTNCLINDAGIFVHKQQRGYHNYALPYSWDVRMGHKTRDAALAELDDDIDVSNVERILREIGYDLEPGRPAGEKRLVAYYTATGDISATTLRERVADSLPDFMLPSHFVQLDAMPLSSNGKVDRSALPAPDAQRPQLRADFQAAGTRLERQLADIWQQVLRIDRIGIDDNFFELGGDSIMAIQVVARARRGGLQLLPAQLVDRPTIRTLAPVVDRIGDDRPDLPGDPALPLPPMAHWLFEQPESVVTHWNQLLHLRLARPLAGTLVAQGLDAVVARHEALRARYRPTPDGWQAEISAAAAAELRQIDIAGIPTQQREARLQAAEQVLHEAIDPRDGRLLAACLVHEGGAATRLSIAVHHLAVDAVSWTILLDDLEVACDALEEGSAPPLPTPDAGLRRWTQGLVAAADSEPVRRDVPLWEDALRRQPAAVEAATPDNPVCSARRHGTLGRDPTTRLLQQVPKTGRIRVAELLTAALARTLSVHGETGDIALYLEGHGRETLPGSADPTQTLGWLSSLYPVTLRPASEDTAGAWINTTKDQLRGLPASGVSYGLLRYLASDAETRRRMRGRERRAVLFNYLGEIERLASGNGLFRAARPLALSRSPAARPRFRLEWNVSVAEGELRVESEFDPGLLPAAEVDGLITDFLASVEHFTAACTDGTGIAPSASDFPLANLDQRKLDQLASVLGDHEPGKARGG